MPALMSCHMDHYLYRWFDEDGVLLYVGISINPRQRAKTHRSTSAWIRWADVMVAEDTPCAAGVDEARPLEIAAILAERPIFNREVPMYASRAQAYILGRGGDPMDVPGLRLGWKRYLKNYDGRYPIVIRPQTMEVVEAEAARRGVSILQVLQDAVELRFPVARADGTSANDRIVHFIAPHVSQEA